VQMWEQIWREAQRSRHGRGNMSPHFPLPDPPAVKNLLRAELQLLLLTLRDQSVRLGKSVLTEECEALKKDVQILQESVELEYQRQAGPELVEPTLTELREERRVIQRDLQALRLTDKASCSDMPNPCVPPAPTRDSMLATVTASDPQMKISLALPRTDCPGTNPSPPASSRQPGLSGQPWDRPASKVLAPEPARRLDSDQSGLSHCMFTAPAAECPTLPHSTSGSSVRSSHHSVVPREKRCAERPVGTMSSIPHLAVGSDLGQPHRSMQPGPDANQPLPPLYPTPPAVQRMASRGQQASRRMRFLQAGSLLSPS
ncbi:hypothetical protein P4O66_016984, partial [Electrophorus voltai]